ncbi:hypothetical protein [Priestia abyssalis]|uniref:hypothetical protein n=1 Tax=Priestia abyssalis TaxID=1221450 RepID=UPI000994D7EE|nr:hypothetical protein [Priestia abyssalis]
MKAIPKTSVHAFLSNLIDYAGLFPPASLPLEPAIRNYAAYRADKDAWMLGRFIIPAVQLEELAPYVSMFSSEQPLIISVLGGRSDNAEACQNGLRMDLEKVVSFCRDYGDAVGAEVFELPLPPVQSDGDLLEVIARETAEHGLHTFCEVTVPLNEDWEHHMFGALDAIATHNARGGPKLGVKLRTGGVTADAFPTVEQVAAVLVGCRDRGITLKFTAGLHHPIRMHRREIDARMHGFLNVFSAGMLAHTHHLNVLEAVEILADEEPSSFFFTAEGLAWRNLTIPASKIVQLREKVLCSYGSCSFDEPRDDLQTLGIYPGSNGQ